MAGLLLAVPTAALLLGNTAPLERIVFFGDSLVHRSNAEHALLERVRQGLVGHARRRRFELVDAGRNGDRIADLRKRLREDVLPLHPSAVVLYWDSDVSDVSEDGMGPAEREALRGAYEADVAFVVRELGNAGAGVILAGPTLIGEESHGRNPKDAQLDAYVALNRSLAARLRVLYVDTRKAFLAHHAGPGQASRLTEDGEHMSEAGVKLLSHQFVRALDHWLRKRKPAL